MIGRMRRGPLELLTKAATSPQRIVPALKREARNHILWRKAKGDMVAYYRSVVEADVRSVDPNRAIGSFSQEHWLEIGQKQFSYLLAHGLKPSDRLLEIGCGNLRAGWRLIDYLDADNYTGTDIAPSVLASAKAVVAERHLESKNPTLLLVDEMSLTVLADRSFDVIHAHSVFTHLSLDIIDACVATAARLLKPEGFFDFTYLAGSGNVKLEDFYYQPDQLEEIAQSHGFRAERMGDWQYSQQKMRLRPWRSISWR